MSGIYIRHAADYVHSFEPYYRETEAVEVIQGIGLQTVLFHMQKGISGCFQSVPGESNAEVYYVIRGRLRIMPLDEEPFVIDAGGFFAFCDRQDGTLFYIQQDTELLCVSNTQLYQGNQRITRKIDDMINELQQKDGDTRSHGERVRRLVMQMICHMDHFDASKLEVLLQASRIHDVGKAKIPLSILIKPGALTDEEHEVIKTHVRYSAELVEDLFDGELAQIVLHHHENYDGTGYPDGLKGEQIPICSRVIAVAEAYDAMVISRSYHKGISHKEAIRELKHCSGSQFDPDCVKALCRTFKNADFSHEDTILRKTESQIAAYESEKARRDFLSNMSHDMRTPMNAIINLTQLAREDRKDQEKLLDDLDKIDTSSRFLLSLVNDILDMSKIEHDKIEFHPAVTTYKIFCDYIESVIVPLCREKHIRFEWEKATVTTPIYVDPVRFQQIFFNILSNAVKFSPDGAVIRFAENHEEKKDGRMLLQFLVEDQGIGMSKEFQQKIFTPFERENISDARMGTGLGLAITKRIIDQMGGKIEIESQLGEGTKIRVELELPVPTRQQVDDDRILQEQKNKSYQYYDIRGAHILIVEDHPLNREIVMRILQKAGVVIDVAENGQEAIEKFGQSAFYSYDAILMDVRMPVVDGLTATRTIRSMKRPDAQNVLIVAMTAEAFEENRRDTISAGMDEHLSKPIVPSELYRTLAVGIMSKRSTRNK